MRHLLLTLALMLGALASGCAPEAANTDVTSGVTTDETTSSSTVTSEGTTSCASRCSERYESCISGEPDATQLCLCHNQRVICIRSCGLPGGGLELCPTSD